MSTHDDALQPLGEALPLPRQLEAVHAVLRERFDFVDRVAVAVHDPKTDLLKTFIHSSGGSEPLPHYQAKLADVPSLVAILEDGHPRVVNDLEALYDPSSEHSRALRTEGYGASYTMPIRYRGRFVGFLFFNSYRKDVFSEQVLHDLDLFGHLLALLVASELAAADSLGASVRTFTELAHQRDLETGSHLDRMSNYARLIARALASKYGLDDDTIEHIFLFSPLHDIGKVAIPDRVLQKPGPLSPVEYALMKTHSARGGEIIDTMLANFGLEALNHTDILRNIALHHHEAVNGTGYPHGLRDGDIPLEARIVAVADVFDALTSRRCYKDAWSNEDAFDMLRKLAGSQLDQDCVEALVSNVDEVRSIQERFREDALG